MDDTPGYGWIGTDNPCDLDNLNLSLPEALHMLAGCKIVGIEPIDYPTTDGIALYLRTELGKPLYAEISTDPYAEEDADSAPVKVEVREIPPDAQYRFRFAGGQISEPVRW